MIRSRENKKGRDEKEGKEGKWEVTSPSNHREANN